MADEKTTASKPAAKSSPTKASSTDSSKEESKEEPKQEAQILKSTQEIALERMIEDDPEFSKKIVPGETRPLVEDGFVGVDPEYRNYARDTEKPMRAEEGAYKAIEDRVLGDPDEESDDKSEDESKDKS